MNDIYRKEMKYLLHETEFKRMRELLAPHTEEDRFHFQKIHNIYFDNKQDEIICRSIEKPVFKQKMRLRTYEAAGQFYPYGYLELKKKYEGIVFKRRLQLPAALMPQILRNNLNAAVLGQGQIAKEMLYFQERTGCYPKVYLSYDRYCYKGRDDGKLRITFDTNILCRTDNLGMYTHESDHCFMDESRYIMEIKGYGAVPMWLAALLTQEKQYPVSFSKYGRIFQNRVMGAKAKDEGLCLTA